MREMIEFELKTIINNIYSKVFLKKQHFKMSKSFSNAKISQAYFCTKILKMHNIFIYCAHNTKHHILYIDHPFDCRLAFQN